MQDQRERQIYFPEGRWVNYFDNKDRIEGRRAETVEAHLSTIPVYVKEGSVILEFNNGSYKFKDIENQTIVIKAFVGTPAKGVKKFILNGKELTLKYEITKTSAKATIEGWDKVKLVTL